MVSTVTVVETERQLADAIAVRYQVFVEEQGVSADAERDHLDVDPRTVHVVAYDTAGRPIGAGRLLAPHTDTFHGEGTGHGAMSADSAHIGRLAVLADHRGTGVGVALMQELERQAWLRFAGGTSVTVELSAQEQAAGFYERLGYRLWGEGYWDEGIWHRDAQKIVTGPDQT